MTGEQLFSKYQDKGPDDYADLLILIYSSIREKLFPLLSKAEKENKKLAIKPFPVDTLIRDFTEEDIIIV